MRTTLNEARRAGKASMEQAEGCADCISRRGFLAQAGLAATAAALAACGGGDGGGETGGGGNPTGPTGPGGSIVVRLADHPELAQVGMIVKVQGARILSRTGPSSFAAFSSFCTHATCDTSVSDARTAMECPCHGSRFAATGAVLRGPAERPLRAVSAVYDSAQGTVTLGV